MYTMGTDRKPWSAPETRALISLRNDMNVKFQTMKRNRSLWEDLSEKLRKHFGHERTATQCSVRWKNIIAAYKESRDCIKTSPQDARVCAFFKEVEAVLGDEPLLLPTISQPETLRTEELAASTTTASPRASTTPPTSQPSNTPPVATLTARRRDRDNASILTAIRELRASVNANARVLQNHTRVLSRLEKLLTKPDGDVQFEPTQDVITEPERVLMDETHPQPDLHEENIAETHANPNVDQPTHMAEAREEAVAENTTIPIEVQDGATELENEAGDLRVEGAVSEADPESGVETRGQEDQRAAATEEERVDRSSRLGVQESINERERIIVTDIVPTGEAGEGESEMDAEVEVEVEVGAEATAEAEAETEAEAEADVEVDGGVEGEAVLSSGEATMAEGGTGNGMEGVVKTIQREDGEHGIEVVQVDTRIGTEVVEESTRTANGTLADAGEEPLAKKPRMESSFSIQFETGATS